ncbi:MAG: hypothetical protein J5552_06960 [Prevotella sp.]|nr:hypothetical protein [Prevotella sp.]
MLSLLLDIIVEPRVPRHVIDTIVTRQEVSDSLRYAEESGAASGGSPLLNWGIPLLLAALAACLGFIFLYRRRLAEKVRPC